MILLFSFSACDSGDSDIPDGDDDLAIDGDMDEVSVDGDEDNTEYNICSDGDWELETSEDSKADKELECSGYCRTDNTMDSAFCSGMFGCTCSEKDDPEGNKWRLWDCHEICNEEGSFAIDCDYKGELPFSRMCVCASWTTDERYTGECDPGVENTVCSGNKLCRCVPTADPQYPGFWSVVDCKEYCDYLGKVTCGCIDGRATLQEACICR